MGTITGWQMLPVHMQAGDDALDRKRASHMLQQLLPPSELRTPHWTAWFTLHSLLEEFGMHLIKPAWRQVGLGSHTVVPWDCSIPARFMVIYWIPSLCVVARLPKTLHSIIQTWHSCATLRTLQSHVAFAACPECRSTSSTPLPPCSRRPQTQSRCTCQVMSPGAF
jgi:hypothetical protein